MKAIAIGRLSHNGQELELDAVEFVVQSPILHRLDMVDAQDGLAKA